MKTVALVLVALGISIIEALRAPGVADDDDAVGLFIGSARPLAAQTRAAKHPR